MTNELWTTATGVLLTVAGVVGAFGVGLVGAMALFFMFLGLLAVSLSVNCKCKLVLSSKGVCE